MAERVRPHLLVPESASDEAYASPRRPPGDDVLPPRDRIAHASRLDAELRAADAAARQRRQGALPTVEDAIEGIYLVFDSRPGVALALQSLDPQQGQRHPELRAVREVEVDGDIVERATVWIPEGTLGRFLKALAKYLGTAHEEKPQRRRLFDGIETIGLASIEQLWTEPDTDFPDPQDLTWWEVWLRKRDGEEVTRLTSYAEQTGMEVASTALGFADHTVVHARGTAEQLAGALDVLDDLAELRRPREPTSLIAEEDPRAQADWIAQLAARTQPPAADAPAVTVVDTGVAQEHPLLEAALSPDDCHTCDLAWGTDDRHGHGTEMAGLALYGDLGGSMRAAGKVQLPHLLESVKLLPRPGSASEPQSYGAITAIAASRVEIAAPERPRAFAIAATTQWEVEPSAREPSPGYGRPSAWSSAVDALAAGLGVDMTSEGTVFLDEEGARTRRLFILAAGNVRERFNVEHLARSDVSPVESPGQAWNALTVGAYTELDSLAGADGQGFQGWSPVARKGELSPFSRTSLVFESRGGARSTRWPVKPDVVFEGGNLARDEGATQYDTPPPLQLLTTRMPKSGARLLTVTHGTSPAVAQAGHLAGQIMAEYPAFWPETVRGLIVHSAEWTPAMRAHCDRAGTQRQRVMLQRRYGMGVPNTDRALRSAADALTLVAQDVIHPYDGEGRTREMHLHELPWPREALLALGDLRVRMRVTLSYFVDPNPSSRGWRDRYSYPSHQLRFAVRGPAESTDEFRSRVNKLARHEEGARSYRAPEDDASWHFGANARTTGSLHTDIWTGEAASLATRGMLAIYPVTGWWKLRKDRDRSDEGAPYALIVSIETPEADTDIWTPVAQQIGIPIEIE